MPLRLHRLAGCPVLSTCDLEAAGLAGPDVFPAAFVDMAGPGAERSPFGSTIGVVLRFVPTAGIATEDLDRAVRRETLRVARDLAASTLAAEPGRVDTYGWPASPADATLPSVVAIVQVASEGPFTDTFLRGGHMRAFEPIVLDPRALLTGELTNGAYDWQAVRNLTAFYQDSALVRELFAAHGDRLRFSGLILTPGYLDTAEAKRRAAEDAAALAAELGAEGAICTTFSSGNSHTDTMLTLRACERRGIGTVALVCETNGGLTDHVPEADSLISTGNEDELVDAWTPGRVIGGERSARVAESVPTWAYLGACSQTGDADWTAVPA
jgi:glycine reductase